MKKKITGLMFLTLAITMVTYYSCKKENSDNSSITTPPAETCSDGIKNQSETGVDCGGPCAACVCTAGTYTCSALPDCVPGTYCVQETCNSGSKSFQSTVTLSGDKSTITFSNFANKGGSIGAAMTNDSSYTIYNQLVSGVAYAGSGTISRVSSKIVLTMTYTLSMSESDQCNTVKYSKK